MTTSLVSQQVENGQKVTLEAIETDLNNDQWDALYFASEEQISKLISEGRICEDFSFRYENYQEELRVIRANAAEEFSQF
tara:strand:+ start:1688 stop:1927 length:240 start_codon:yes stop_codon:yes gene_type:complete